jgi:hypothetical protein
LLAHVIHRICRRWPQVVILVRGDGHHCAPEVLDLLHCLRCDYVLGLSRNKMLDALAEPWREQCRWRWKPGTKVRRFHQFQYAADTWTRQEEVIASPAGTTADVSFSEDAQRNRKDHGPANIAVLRRRALDVARLDQSKGSLTVNVKRAGWNDDFTLTLLSQMR